MNLLELFRRDRNFTAITARRFGIRKLIYNRRILHLIYCLCFTTGISLGMIFTSRHIVAGEAVFFLAMMSLLGVAIFMAITAVTIEHVQKYSKAKTILMSNRVYNIWHNAMMKRYPKATHTEWRRAEAYMVENNNLWWDFNDSTYTDATIATAMRSVVWHLPASVINGSY